MRSEILGLQEYQIGITVGCLFDFCKFYPGIIELQQIVSI
jgi:hypothetical protein